MYSQFQKLGSKAEGRVLVPHHALYFSFTVKHPSGTHGNSWVLSQVGTVKTLTEERAQGQ